MPKKRDNAPLKCRKSTPAEIEIRKKQRIMSKIKKDAERFLQLHNIRALQSEELQGEISVLKIIKSRYIGK